MIVKSFMYLLLVTALFALSACGNENNNGPTNSMSSVTELPTAVLTLPSGGQLRAYITIDAGTRSEMVIVANTAATVIPGLSRATHTVLIEFEFTDSASNTVTVATATQTVDLSSGNVNISLTDSDYDLASYDDDGDGISNAKELADGTNPVDAGCVVGFSLIGSCTL
jgi:hypothetical protein